MQQIGQDAELTARAREMAASGRFPSWRLIEIELRFMEGRREAAGLFTDRDFREALDAACRKAWQAPAPSGAGRPPLAEVHPHPAVVPAPAAPPLPPVHVEAPHGRKYLPA